VRLTPPLTISPLEFSFPTKDFSTFMFLRFPPFPLQKAVSKSRLPLFLCRIFFLGLLFEGLVGLMVIVLSLIKVLIFRDSIPSLIFGASFPTLMLDQRLAVPFFIGGGDFHLTFLFSHVVFFFRLPLFFFSFRRADSRLWWRFICLSFSPNPLGPLLSFFSR